MFCIVHRVRQAFLGLFGLEYLFLSEALTPVLGDHGLIRPTGKPGRR